MRVPFLLLVLVVLTLSGCALVPDEPAVTRIVTYNVRLDTDVDGENAWSYRRMDVAALLRFYAPDIFGLQEVQAHQLEQLKADLGRYEFVGVGRDDGREAGEYSPLAYARDRYTLIGQGTFWLSATPDRPSLGFDAAYPRLVTWVRLVERRSRNRILALNTHWDHVGIEARLASGRMIRDWITSNRIGCENVAVFGDFNAAPDEASLASLAIPGKAALSLALSISESPPFGPPGTFNAFDIFSRKPAPIDHIFVSEGVRVLRHGVITQHNEGRLPSDHYLVLADVEMPACRLP